MPFSTTLAALGGWLAEHAPLTARDLAPPATVAELVELRRHLGTELMSEVEDLLEWHNGVRAGAASLCLAPGFAFLGSAGMLAAARERAAADERHLFWRGWHPQWLPVAAGKRGAHLVVDHSDGPDRGRVMISSVDDGGNFSKSWADLGALLARTYEAMRFGGRFLSQRRELVGGRLVWDD